MRLQSLRPRLPEPHRLHGNTVALHSEVFLWAGDKNTNTSVEFSEWKGGKEMEGGRKGGGRREGRTEGGWSD